MTPAVPRGMRPPWTAPSAAFISSVSLTSTSSASCLASSDAVSISSWAALRQPPMSSTRSGSLRTAARRSRARGSVARRRARPMWPCVARAATAATPGSMPSRRTRMSATASTGGVRRVSRRQRERMVGRTSSMDGAHRSQTVRGAGSSTAFSRTLPAPSVRRSASSRTMTCQRPVAGDSWARRTRSRVSFTPMESMSVRTICTSAWVPIRLVWQPSQKPQPGTAAQRAVGAHALERGRERPRRRGTARAGRAGEQPGVRHLGRLGRRGARGDRRDEGVGVTGSGGELLAHLLLAHQVVPHGHGAPPFRRTSPCRVHCAGRH